MRKRSDFHYGKNELIRFWKRAPLPVKEMMITLINRHDESRVFRILDRNNVVLFQNNARNGWSLLECEKWMLSAAR